MSKITIENPDVSHEVSTNQAQHSGEVFLGSTVELNVIKVLYDRMYLKLKLKSRLENSHAMTNQDSTLLRKTEK